jgi:hypothetical protein
MKSDPQTVYRRARTASLVLLFFLGISALGGAAPMILDPGSRDSVYPLELLGQTPFKSFLIPGLILAVFNGILSLVFAILILNKHPLESWFLWFQGAVLLGWLTTELFMDVIWLPLTLTYYVVAVLLVVCGILLHKFRTH